MDKMKKIKKTFHSVKLPLMTNSLCLFRMWRIFFIHFPCTFRWTIRSHQFHYYNLFLVIINQTKILAVINYNSL